MHEVVAKPRPKRRKLTFSQYYNASQLRADTWNRLKHDALRLAEAETREPDIERLRESVAEALDLLEPIESYWAFPGREAIAGLRRLLETADYRNLAATRRPDRAGARRPTPTAGGRSRCGPAQDASTTRARSRRPSMCGEERRTGGPISRSWWSTPWGRCRRRRCKQGLRHARRPDDPFLYELLVVQSVEDALIAVLTNYNIQTVVIRFSFPYRAAHQIRVLQRELFGRRQAAFEAVSPADRGILLCEVIGRLRPGAVRLHRHRRLDRGDGRPDAAQLPARVLSAGGLPRAAPEHPARRRTPATRRRSSPRSRSTAGSRPACSTPCRSAAASRSPSPTGSRTWASSTG